MLTPTLFKCGQTHVAVAHYSRAWDSMDDTSQTWNRGWHSPVVYWSLSSSIGRRPCSCRSHGPSCSRSSWRLRVGWLVRWLGRVPAVLAAATLVFRW